MTDTLTVRGRQATFTVDVEHFRRRLLEDCLNEGLATTWENRAALFEWARPRPTDFTGQASTADLADQDARLAADALACRQKAAVMRGWPHG